MQIRRHNNGIPNALLRFRRDLESALLRISAATVVLSTAQCWDFATAVPAPGRHDPERSGIQICHLLLAVALLLLLLLAVAVLHLVLALVLLPMLRAALVLLLCLSAASAALVLLLLLLHACHPLGVRSRLL